MKTRTRILILAGAVLVLAAALTLALTRPWDRAIRIKTPLSPEEIVKLVKEYVQNNYSGDLDLNTIAQNLGFSSSYLTKVFNRVDGITPSKYIRNYRMGIAKQLMNDKGMTLQQIAAAVGYNDPFHFSRSFKQTFGMNPTEYRESLNQ